MSDCMICSGEKMESGQKLLHSFRNKWVSPWVIVWGWESTVDYRFSLSSSELASTGLLHYDSDGESGVSQAFFSRVVNSIQHKLGRAAMQGPGGSPLLSALAVNQLRGWNTQLVIPEPIFWGICPPLMRVLAQEADWSHLLRYAIIEPRIVGSLCLEYHDRSVRQVLSVFEGRVLNRQVSRKLARTLSRILTDYEDRCVVLGIGGVNKSAPQELKAQISLFRSSATRAHIVFITTNSFSPILRLKKRDMLMEDYFDLLRLADVVSMSAEELCQLARWSGLSCGRESLYPLLRGLKLPGLAICHHRYGSAISTGNHLLTEEAKSTLKGVLSIATLGMLQYCQDGVTILGQLSEDFFREQQRLTGSEFEEVFGLSSSDQCAVPSPRLISNGSVRLTGLGARFDGYLSVLFAGAWQWLVQK
jgi:hypothetical protein